MHDQIVLAELLCTRLCHELVSPAGAVSSGAELLGGGGAGPPEAVDREALALLEESAHRAIRRLKFYRAAYGRGGGAGAGLALAEVRALAEGVLDEGRTRFDWQAPGLDEDRMLASEAARLILNLLLFAHEALPRGGMLRIELDEAGGEMRARIRAEAGRVAISPASRAAFEQGRAGALDAATLTVRNVHAAFTGALVARAGAPLEVREDAPGALEIVVRLAP